MSYYVYILTNKVNTVLYIGVTNNIQRRTFEHRSDLIAGFTRKYRLHKLVYFEEYADILDALEREKRLKRWHRDWKFNLIRSKNPSLDEIDRC